MPAEPWQWALLVPALYYAVVLASVAWAVLFCHWSRRKDGMDEDQARAFGDVRRPLGRRLSGLAVEAALQAVAFLLQAVHTVRLLPRVRGSGRGTPVIVLPGYTENSGTTWWLCRRLAALGFNVHPVQFPSTFSDMEKNKLFLRGEIARVRAEHDGAEVAIVGHSMGGVIARALILSEADHGVKALVAFASPFRGTHQASVGAFFRMGRSVAQMRRGSEFNGRYSPDRDVRVPLLSVVAVQEDIVSPEWSVVVAGARVHVLDEPWGHEAPLFLPGPIAVASDFLREHGVVAAGRGVSEVATSR